MGPTISIRRPSTAPPLPVARLHGAEADFDRAQRSIVGAVAIALVWLLPVLALVMTIGFTS
jgi:hypothetical protein